jgi:hypothetical protein
MGYGGKATEQHRARELRAQSWTLQDIATELNVSKSVGVVVGTGRRVHAATPQPRPPIDEATPAAHGEARRDRAVPP